MSYPQASLESGSVRVYPSYGRRQLAAHAVGYVGRISPDGGGHRKVDGYADDNIRGKVGAEKLFESKLGGVRGNEHRAGEQPRPGHRLPGDPRTAASVTMCSSPSTSRPRASPESLEQGGAGA